MELLSLNLSRVRIPDPTDRIFNQQCCLSFDTPKSEGGLFVDMNSFLAFGKDFVGLNYEKTGNPVYLHIKETQKLASENRPSMKSTLRVIDLERGFGNIDPGYEQSYAIVILPDYVTIPFPSVELPEKVRLAAQAVIVNVGVEKKEHVAANDVFCCDEDASLMAPLLAQRFDIDSSSLQKTKTTTAEEELDQNTNFDWNHRNQKSEQKVEPSLFGLGYYTGLVNLGNRLTLQSTPMMMAKIRILFYRTMSVCRIFWACMYTMHFILGWTSMYSTKVYTDGKSVVGESEKTWIGLSSHVALGLVVYLVLLLLLPLVNLIHQCIKRRVKYVRSKFAVAMTIALYPFLSVYVAIVVQDRSFLWTFIGLSGSVICLLFCYGNPADCGEGVFLCLASILLAHCQSITVRFVIAVVTTNGYLYYVLVLDKVNVSRKFLMPKQDLLL